MDKLINKLESILADCVEDHGYNDEDEAPLYGVTIGEVKLIVHYLKEREELR